MFDLSGGKRDFLSKEKAETLFKPLFNTEQKIHTVCETFCEHLLKLTTAKVILSTKSFGLDAADVACKALLEAVVATLHTANLSDIIGGRPVDCLILYNPPLRASVSRRMKHCRSWKS